MMDMLRSSRCDVLHGLFDLWLWIQDLSGWSYYVPNRAFYTVFSDIPSIKEYHLTRSSKNTAVPCGEGTGGFAGWEERMSFHVRVLCHTLVM